jgi:4-hydroxybenzoyl-CoA reductase subunit beta
MNILPDFDYIRPLTVDAAVAALAAAPTAKPVAGATDLLPNLRRGLGRPEALVDISAIAGLGLIEETAQGFRIGAGVPLAGLARHLSLLKALPVIAEAALAVAGPTHRAAGTVGGNLCQDTRCIFYNQSEWWRSGNDYCLKYQGDRCHVALKSKSCFATYRGDLAPALMVLGAEVELAGPAGRRVLPLAELFRNDGAQHLTLEAGEILTAVLVPKTSAGTAGYAKIRIRDAIDFPLAGVAAALSRDGDILTGIDIAITGIASAPLMVPTGGYAGQPWGEETIRQLIASVSKAAKAQNTTTVGTKYRRQVLLAAARRLLDDLWAQMS